MNIFQRRQKCFSGWYRVERVFQESSDIEIERIKALPHAGCSLSHLKSDGINLLSTLIDFKNN